MKRGPASRGASVVGAGWRVAGGGWRGIACPWILGSSPRMTITHVEPSSLQPFSARRRLGGRNAPTPAVILGLEPRIHDQAHNPNSTEPAAGFCRRRVTHPAVHARQERGRRELIAQKNQSHHPEHFPARAGRAYNAPVPPSDASGHANPARRGRCREWERSQAFHFRGEIRASLAEEATCLCGTQADHKRHPERVEVRVERANFRAEKHRTGRRRVPYIF